LANQEEVSICEDSWGCVVGADFCRIITVAVLGYSTFVAAWGSSIYSSATYAIAAHFHVGIEVSLLGVSFYVLGFAFGPLVCEYSIKLYDI
jgi:predicted phage tail protein